MNPKARELMILVVALVVAILAVRFVFAGSLNPTVPRDSTMTTSEEVYNALRGTGFDASGFTADSGAGAVNIAKCIIQKMRGGSC